MFNVKKNVVGFLSFVSSNLVHATHQAHIAAHKVDHFVTDLSLWFYKDDIDSASFLEEVDDCASDKNDVKNDLFDMVVKNKEKNDAIVNCDGLCKIETIGAVDREGVVDFLCELGLYTRPNKEEEFTEDSHIGC